MQNLEFPFLGFHHVDYQIPAVHHLVVFPTSWFCHRRCCWKSRSLDCASTIVWAPLSCPCTIWCSDTSAILPQFHSCAGHSATTKHADLHFTTAWFFWVYGFENSSVHFFQEFLFLCMGNLFAYLCTGKVSTSLDVKMDVLFPRTGVPEGCKLPCGALRIEPMPSGRTASAVSCWAISAALHFWNAGKLGLDKDFKSTNRLNLNSGQFFIWSVIIFSVT